MTRRGSLAHCTALLLAAAALPGLLLPGSAAGAPAAAATEARSRILVVGDSLSAEYGLQRGSGWVALLERRLKDEGLAATVVNASISGDTTSGGRSRLPALLKEHRPTLVILELGGNDALRGLPLEKLRDNLGAMTRAARQAGARVLIVGMQIPPNYGRDYAERFSSAFADVARAEGAALVPFMLRGVADAAEPESFFQPDRIHPLARAHPVILENIWSVLGPMLKQPLARNGAG